MSALAIICRFFHVRSLFRSQPVPLVKAVAEAPQVFLVIYNFPAFENKVGLADDASASVAADHKRVNDLSVFPVDNVHHVPPRAERFARAGLVADRYLRFCCWHALRITLGSSHHYKPEA